MFSGNRDESLGALDRGFVVGGTAWLWSHVEVENELNYLFIDEAGQMQAVPWSVSGPEFHLPRKASPVFLWTHWLRSSLPTLGLWAEEMMISRISIRSLWLMLAIVCALVSAGVVAVWSIPFSSTYEEIYKISSFPDKTDDTFVDWLSSAKGVNRVVVSRPSNNELAITYLIVQKIGSKNELPEIATKLNELGYEIEPSP